MASTSRASGSGSSRRGNPPARDITPDRERIAAVPAAYEPQARDRTPRACRRSPRACRRSRRARSRSVRVRTRSPRTRTRSPRTRSRSPRARSRSPHLRHRRSQKKREVHRADNPREKHRNHVRGAPEEETSSDEMNISHILVKHRKSKRRLNQYNTRISWTKGEAMNIVCDIHTRITRDLITFASAVISYSECLSAESEGGGDIQSEFERGNMSISFKTTAIDLDPGKMSNVVETKSGYLPYSSAP